MKEYHLLAVLEEKLGGSRYHRVKLPLTSIDNTVVKIGEEECTVKVTFKDSTMLEEEDFKNNDMVYFNWSLQNGVNWVSTMAQQHNVKVIQDIDDFWILPKKHIQHKVDYSRVPLFAAIADGLVVATNRLALNLSKINENICINYNELPVGEGQFQIVDRPKNEGKVRVGIDTDSRVKQFKGDGRPVNTWEDRTKLMESIRYVYDVVGFSTDDELRQQIKDWETDVMIVGSDYKDKNVIGSELVNEVIFFDRIEGYSTTNTLKNV